MAKVTGPNQFSLAVGHRTTAKVDDCGNRSPFQDWKSLYQHCHWQMINLWWQLPTKCISDHDAWNNLTLRVCLTKIKRRIKLYQIKTQNLFSSFAVVTADFKIYRQEHYKSDRNTTNQTGTLHIWQKHYKSDRNTTNLTGTLQILVVETFLLNRICYNFFIFIQEYWDSITSDCHQNGLLKFMHINLIEQNKTLVSVCVTPDIKWVVDKE